jgi:hypothetical protein
VQKAQDRERARTQAVVADPLGERERRSRACASAAGQALADADGPRSQV